MGLLDGLRGAGLDEPGASASAAVLNHTSASVASYHWPSGVWYFIESLLPLISKPSGASPLSSGLADPSYSPASTGVESWGASVVSSVGVSWTTASLRVVPGASTMVALRALDTAVPLTKDS